MTASPCASRAGRARRRGATRSANSARLARPRHGVVERLVGELLLERLALADVAAVEHDAADVLVVAAGRCAGPRTGARRRRGGAACSRSPRSRAGAPSPSSSTLQQAACSLGLHEQLSKRVPRPPRRRSRARARSTGSGRATTRRRSSTVIRSLAFCDERARSAPRSAGGAPPRSARRSRAPARPGRPAPRERRQLGAGVGTQRSGARCLARPPARAARRRRRGQVELVEQSAGARASAPARRPRSRRLADARPSGERRHRRASSAAHSRASTPRRRASARTASSAARRSRRAGGADQRDARPAQRALARDRPLLLAHEAGHARHDEHEQDDRRADRSTSRSTLPPTSWRSSIAGAISDAPVSSARRSRVSRGSRSGAARRASRIDGCSAAAPHSR